MNYDEKIQHELEHIPEEKKEQLYYVIRTFRRENANTGNLYETSAKYQANREKMTLKWDEVIDESFFLTLLKIKDMLLADKSREAINGLEKLINAEMLKAQDELLSQLEHLMKEIIIWHQRSGFRTAKRVHAIFIAREEIAVHKEEEGIGPDDTFLKRVWDNAFKKALHYAGNEMEEKPSKTILTWKEVFENAYKTDDNVETS